MNLLNDYFVEKLFTLFYDIFSKKFTVTFNLLIKVNNVNVNSLFTL